MGTGWENSDVLCSNSRIAEVEVGNFIELEYFLSPLGCVMFFDWQWLVQEVVINSI